MKQFAYSLFIFLVFSACNSQKNLSQGEANTIFLDTIVVKPQVKPPYRPTPEKKWELIHTSLDLKFNWEQQEVIGRALLKLRPYFYPQSKISIDAKFMDVSQITLSDSIRPVFSYDTFKIHLSLDTVYSRFDTLELLIDYIAKPQTNNMGGGRAITASRGIYFINPSGTEKEKPQQIWTQGETEFASCWFPTLDEPNQKSSQEVKLTVQEKFTTLSNGLLDFSTLNGDGTRTDYWIQEKRHSPYLFMIAVGEFEKTSENWRGKEVSYYLESAYSQDAPYIFGHTPEMMEYYSNLLGVEYPWDKYAQVVVRDYVSGAMENTSATIHGEFVQNHKRELIDYNPDGIIAHELFHQWFGDLVSCESWSNLPLNESFATYGEYLWFEYKYSQDEADYTLLRNLQSYLWESTYKQENWVRNYYQSKDDMFDAHSYSQGARILHMLRKTIGDEAFFESLKLYLTRYAHSSAEMHQLRLCFEEVTGLDLNWFFNQWAFNPGHPVLNITHQTDSLQAKSSVIIEQIQTNDVVYILPLKIVAYSGNLADTFSVTIDSTWFKFEYNSMADFIDIDAEKYLLCSKNESLSPLQVEKKYSVSGNLAGRHEAMEYLGAFDSLSPNLQEMIFMACKDPHYSIRNLAIQQLGRVSPSDSQRVLLTLQQLAESDPDSKVRKSSLNALVNYGFTQEAEQMANIQLADSSYKVLGNALYQLCALNTWAGLDEVLKYENTDSKMLKSEILSTYCSFGTAKHHPWIMDNEVFFTGYHKFLYLRQYEKYIFRLNDRAVYVQAIEHLYGIGKVNSSSKIKKETVRILQKIKTELEKQQKELSTQANPKAAEEIQFSIEFLESAVQEIKP